MQNTASELRPESTTPGKLRCRCGREIRTDGPGALCDEGGFRAKVIEKRTHKLITCYCGSTSLVKLSTIERADELLRDAAEQLEQAAARVNDIPTAQALYDAAEDMRTGCFPDAIRNLRKADEPLGNYMLDSYREIRTPHACGHCGDKLGTAADQPTEVMVGVAVSWCCGVPYVWTEVQS